MLTAEHERIFCSGDRCVLLRIVRDFILRGTVQKAVSGLNSSFSQVPRHLFSPPLYYSRAEKNATCWISCHLKKSLRNICYWLLESFWRWSHLEKRGLHERSASGILTCNTLFFSPLPSSTSLFFSFYSPILTSRFTVVNIEWQVISLMGVRDSNSKSHSGDSLTAATRSFLYLPRDTLLVKVPLDS